jgi:hypothetical protein
MTAKQSLSSEQWAVDSEQWTVSSRERSRRESAVRKAGLPPPILKMHSTSGGKPPFLTALFAGPYSLPTAHCPTGPLPTVPLAHCPLAHCSLRLLCFGNDA